MTKTDKDARDYVKGVIKDLPPLKAIALLELFRLPKYQYNAIFYVDIEGLTLDEAAEKLHTTTDTLKRDRRKGYDNIVKTVHS